MAKNMFANSETFADLDMAYAMVTSPENLAHDGERSRAQTKAAYDRIRTDYNARRYEIVLGK